MMGIGERLAAAGVGPWRLVNTSDGIDFYLGNATKIGVAFNSEDKLVMETKLILMEDIRPSELARLASAAEYIFTRLSDGKSSGSLDEIASRIAQTVKTQKKTTLRAGRTFLIVSSLDKTTVAVAIGLIECD